MQNEQETAFDWAAHEGGKYNTSVKLTPEDKAAGLKIYCKEPYAQELYDKMVAGGKSHAIYSKDLAIGELCHVKAKTINYNDSFILAEAIDSMVPVIVPFKEYSSSLEDLTNGIGIEFYVIISKDDGFGEVYGSERKCRAKIFKNEIVEHHNNNTWFDVKIVSLIKGGYVALYKDEVECFIPGSHAGANVIHDFNEKLGQTISVMVDNYDKSNDLFILSYKKYVKASMSLRINDIEFGKEYVGRLTNRPYDFGAFIEFEDYFTGLLHSSEIENFDEVRKTMKSGDPISFYVKDVTQKTNKQGVREYRTVLTMDKSSVNEEKLMWQQLKADAEGKEFEFVHNTGRHNIEILINGELHEIGIKRSMQGKIDYSNYNFVLIRRVDHIHKSFKFEFVK